jgi:phosphatidylglycerol:prolipoprotein diacylglycerol transferase
VAGLIGARAFYVIEYWNEFQRPTLRETLARILNFTQGGLVVYGALFGGVAVGIIFVRRRRLPVLAMTDLVSPSLMIGLALGRLGCLLNGCCFGGVCESQAPRIRFPIGSPPYVQQLEQGRLLGLVLRSDETTRQVVVVRVAAGSLAEKRGIRAGDRFAKYQLPSPQRMARQLVKPTNEPLIELIPLDDGPRITWAFSDLPSESLPVHPTQIYAAINALLLAILLWVLFPLRPRDGFVFAVLATLYPISRFLLEIIRTDEPGQFGTALSISQCVSLGVLAGVMVFWIYLFARPWQGPTKQLA